MILGVGTDLCRIERVARALENPRFLERVYTPAERASLEGLCPERRAERAAGLFAAKEAVAKALGTGFRGFGPGDVEVLRDELGRPVVSLYGGARREGAVHVSVSHDGGFALAFAVCEEADGRADASPSDSAEIPKGEGCPDGERRTP